MKIWFVCASIEDGFDPKDISIMMNNLQDQAQERANLTDSAALSLFPIYAEAEHSHVFGFLPSWLVEDYPELVADLQTELQLHAEDLDYKPSVNPALNVDVEVCYGFIED